VEIVFVGGVHGSGKSWFCTELAPVFGATHIMASELLRGRSEASKAVTDIDGNQKAILQAIGALKGRTSRVLLDGHFCLTTTAGHIQDVPIEYFQALAPRALLLLEATVSEIEHRLARRGESAFSADLISALLQRERSHATRVEETLCVPLKVLSPTSSIAEATAFLSQLA
jgi:adenylate kinase